jgi:hypothetical protein
MESPAHASQPDMSQYRLARRTRGGIFRQIVDLPTIRHHSGSVEKRCASSIEFEDEIKMMNPNADLVQRQSVGCHHTKSEAAFGEPRGAN